MDVILHIEGGPMDGERFRAEFLSWPPPSRMWGGDIHSRLSGVYELLDAGREPGNGVTACYRLRDDDDQKLRQKAKDRYNVLRNLNEELR